MKSNWKSQLSLMAGTAVLLATVGCNNTPPANTQEADSGVVVTGTRGTALFVAAASAALPPGGLKPADLPDPNTPGAGYVAKYCTSCHALPTPKLHSATDWPAIVRRMWLRMDLVAGDYKIPIPSSAERVSILNYLIDNGIKVSGEMLPDAPGKALFEKRCSRCHALPDPKQHGPEDWGAVVRRMMGHMEDILNESLTRPDFERLVLYLDRASRR